jgi:serine/threonine protein phosphatase PrpC
VGHVGESRIIIESHNGDVEYMNTIHKPSNSIEKERVIGQGGKIYR